MSVARRSFAANVRPARPVWRSISWTPKHGLPPQKMADMVGFDVGNLVREPALSLIAGWRGSARTRTGNLGLSSTRPGRFRRKKHRWLAGHRWCAGENVRHYREIGRILPAFGDQQDLGREPVAVLAGPMICFTCGSAACPRRSRPGGPVFAKLRSSISTRPSWKVTMRCHSVDEVHLVARVFVAR